METKTLYSEESWGGSGHLKLEITVSSDRMPCTDTKPIRLAAYKAADLVKSEIMAAIVEEDPRTEDETLRNRELINIFNRPIFVEEIQNGYCSGWSHRHLPWFIVTTHIGRIKIGWRKRVIEIDWSDTINPTGAVEMFPDEDVTKSSQFIHAWTIEKAEEYIKEILGSI